MSNVKTRKLGSRPAGTLVGSDVDMSLYLTCDGPGCRCPFALKIAVNPTGIEGVFRMVSFTRDEAVALANALLEMTSETV